MQERTEIPQSVNYIDINNGLQLLTIHCKLFQSWFRNYYKQELGMLKMDNLLSGWLSMVLRLRQHNIGYTADGFYRSDDPTNSVKALKEGG